VFPEGNSYAALVASELTVILRHNTMQRKRNWRSSPQKYISRLRRWTDVHSSSLTHSRLRPHLHPRRHVPLLAIAAQLTASLLHAHLSSSIFTSQQPFPAVLLTFICSASSHVNPPSPPKVPRPRPPYHQPESPTRTNLLLRCSPGLSVPRNAISWPPHRRRPPPRRPMTFSPTRRG
jgi:hypothetical protein